MARGGGTATPIEPGIIARVGAALGGAVKGAREAWFGPGEPVAPAAPQAAGRQFDYPVAVNTVAAKPRSEQGEGGISFETLRALADPTLGGFDLLRLAIETRKDQMEAQRWTIRARDGGDGGPRAQQVELAMRKPDGVNRYSVWQRMLLEDLLVIDAPCIYIGPSTQGHRIPEVMDGATLKRLLRPDGRTPLPPEPAFQQILKGLPAVDYTLDELVYSPRNLRSHRIYGMSPVEQVVMTINIALRRQTSQLEYYTAGSVPDVVFGMPPEMQPTQIKEFQLWWDSILSGNTEERRRGRFIPGGIKPFVLNEGKLKDEFDEWLARIVCYAFSLSPQALVRQMNRATADTAKEAAQEEGLEPLKLWWKDTVDEVLVKAFDAPDLELAYIDEEIANPVDKANVLSIALGRGGGKPWMTVDEVRAEYGQDPLTDEQREELTPPPPPALPPHDPQGGQQPPALPAAAKLSKARRSLRP